MQISPVFRSLRGALALVIVAPLLTPVPARAAGTDSSAVVATVGTHKITEAELDAKIKPEMAALESKIYDLKHQALQTMADEYLIDEAAKKAKLSVPDYLKKEIEDKAPKVTEADAKKYYDQ